MIYLKCIMFLVLAVLTPVMLIRDWKYYKRNTIKYKKITKAVIWIHAICSVILAVFILLDDASIRDLSSKLDGVSNQNNMLIKENKEQSTHIEDLLVKMGGYQEQNKRLRDDLQEQMAKTFYQGDPKGGMTVRSRKMAVGEYYTKALKAYKDYDCQKAKDILELVLIEDPSNEKVLNLMGIVLNELGSYEEAVDVLNNAYVISGRQCILRNIKLIKQYPGVRFNMVEVDSFNGE